jgi:tripartite ATP-independent transporter DctM subunit
MTPEIAGLIGIVVLVVLLFSRMWIGLAMAFIGFIGFFYATDIDKAFAILGTVPYHTIAFYPISCVPLFILMGVVVSNTGVSKDLYDSAYKWIGQTKGGLSIATVVACAGFAAIAGDSIAGAITMGKVAYPEMKRYDYNETLATSCIAAGGTLGILIPPSLGFIMYGILIEESIGKLFMAGIFPGLLLAALFIAVILFITTRNPKAGPPGPRTSFQEKVVSLKNTWPILVLFLLVLGGIYLGFFTPTEAGAVGAFGAIVITFFSRRLTVRILIDSLLEAAKTTAMIMILVMGAFILMRFLTISGLTTLLVKTIGSLTFSKYIIFALIIVFYIIVGMFLDIMASMVVTIPFVYPMVMALGFDSIWFGVVLVLVMEMGLITPPVGLNVFALAGVTNVPIGTIFRGVWWFVAAMLLCVVIITIFPQIALFIPNIM